MFDRSRTGSRVQQIVGGSISRLGRTYSVSCRVIDVETSEILAVATLDFEGEIDELLRTGMKVVALRLTGQDAEYHPVKRRKPPRPDVIRYPWQALMSSQTDRNLEANLDDDNGTSLVYTTRFLPRIWGSSTFTLRPSVTPGMLYQQINEPHDSHRYDSWRQDVYMMLPELYLGYELKDFNFTLFTGLGPGYYDYTGIRDHPLADALPEESDQAFEVTYTAGMQVSLHVLFVQLVGQVRYIHTPGIENSLLLPSVGLQTKSTFWAILPWILVVRHLV